jgi:uncharacterized membrane protein
VRFFGLIPAGVGLAFLIYYAIEGRREREEFEREAAEARSRAASKSTGVALPPG